MYWPCSETHRNGLKSLNMYNFGISTAFCQEVGKLLLFWQEKMIVLSTAWLGGHLRPSGNDLESALNVLAKLGLSLRDLPKTKRN